MRFSIPAFLVLALAGCGSYDKTDAVSAKASPVAAGDAKVFRSTSGLPVDGQSTLRVAKGDEVFVQVFPATGYAVDHWSASTGWSGKAGEFGFLYTLSYGHVTLTAHLVPVAAQ